MNKFYLEYFTDPLCCWSWGLEPQLRKLRYLLKNRLQINYVMGGLLRDWEHYSDQLNCIIKPSQMGPLWVEAKHLSGQPIDEHLWINNPVDTSYPACMAVKVAENQSFIAGEAMLRELREAVMIHKKNIGDTDVIMEIAENLEEKAILNYNNFKVSLLSNESSDFFRKDLEKVKLKGVTRFPTMLIQYGEKTVQITGYRPFSVLLDTFKFLDPSLKIDEKINTEDYITSWHNLTKRELQEIS
ncbi:DsbA family protein [Salegentibacter sp. JZCK2]|uniref:DsbA family protein n=1 Tax=Salegentibacter tibetensis TaxID=2873600 RepID=UPI001CCFA0C2|nr:DsbA family protein [Salegentibacter tibetensis]MBZ9730115.1 DsbA family protein [Salegentibacter tibetensis]